MATNRARAAVVLLCLLAACSSRTQGPQGAVAVTAADDTLDAIGATTQMSAVLLDGQGEPKENSGFAWTSSNTAVATVNAAGVVTAQGNGTAVISARSDRNVVGTANVVVEQIATAIEITPADWPTGAAWIGARRQFTATAWDANGVAIANPDIDWSASDATVISVDGGGLATAMSDGVNVLVTAVVDAAMDSLNVTVNADGGNGPGTMYTIWFARSDDAPALLANGRIHVPDRIITDIPWADPAPPWPHSRPTVHKFQWEGDRIGILTDMADGSGTFRVRHRRGEWVNLFVGNVVDFQLEGNLIGVLERGGRVRVNDGTAGPWTELASSGAAGLQIEGNRIAVLGDDGSLRVQTGIGGAATEIVPAGDDIRFELENNRVVVLHSDGSLRAKDVLTNPWTDIGSHVTDFRLSGNRIAFLDESNILRVQDGLNDTPTMLTSVPLAQFEILGSRVGIHLASGQFRVTDNINGAWTELAGSDVREFQLQENLIGYVRDSDGMLRIKEGINGVWNNSEDVYGANVTQFRLVVDVPSPPFRTTPASYLTNQQFCINEQARADNPNNCYHVSGFDLPVSNYGFYCGQGRPTEFLYAAVNQPPIDSLDENCKHHDLIESWYSESQDGFDGDVFGACIVRYGIVYGRLTRDGVLLTHGGDTEGGWEAGWSGSNMGNLKDALDNYFTHTNLCNSENLDLFAEVTAAQH